MASHSDVAKVVAKLSAAYPNWNANEYTIEVYYEDLKDISRDELEFAAQHCRTEIGRKFAPSVGELRGAVADLRRASTNLPDSYQAWQEVQKQILENGGDYGIPVWSNSLVEEAVRRMGWRNLRMSEDQVSDRMRFLQCYEQLVERATKDEMLLPEVREFIETRGGRLLNAPQEHMKQLAARMTK